MQSHSSSGAHGAPSTQQPGWLRRLRHLAGLLWAMSVVAACATAAQAESAWRVGRIVQTDGAVSLWREGAGSTPERIDALPGQPDALRDWRLAVDDRIRTAADGRAELDLGEVRMRLGGRADLALLALDDDEVTVQLTAGSLAWRVEQGDVREVHVDTPLSTVDLQAAGLYRADVGPQGDRITVLRGRAEVRQPQGSVTLGPGQSATLWPGGGWRMATAEADDFSRWALGLEQPSGRYVELPPRMTGAGDLQAYGDWTTVPQWGSVWVPRGVPQGWAPYQRGRWVWQPGWGWTWVDDYAWGFTTYTYGRWVPWNDRWAWVPGARVPPVANRPPPGQPPAGWHHERPPAGWNNDGHPNRPPGDWNRQPTGQEPWRPAPGTFPRPQPSPRPEPPQDPRRVRLNPPPRDAQPRPPVMQPEPGAVTPPRPEPERRWQRDPREQPSAPPAQPQQPTGAMPARQGWPGMTDHGIGERRPESRLPTQPMPAETLPRPAMPPPPMVRPPMQPPAPPPERRPPERSERGDRVERPGGEPRGALTR